MQRDPDAVQPEQCASMAELRAVIDAIDTELVSLLRRRQDCIDRAVTLKARENLPARIPARVADVLEKVRARSQENGLDPDLAETLWHAMIEWAIAREERAMARQDRTTTE
jgi:isochorismate pyruvate lyase